MQDSESEAACALFFQSITKATVVIYFYRTGKRFVYSIDSLKQANAALLAVAKKYQTQGSLTWAYPMKMENRKLEKYQEGPPRASM